jgi:hypothetical protein
MEIRELTECLRQSGGYQEKWRSRWNCFLPNGKLEFQIGFDGEISR